MSLNPVSNLIAMSTGIIVLLILGYNVYVMNIAKNKIFPGSGTPISMAQVVLNSIQATSQFLFGLFVVGLLTILIIEKTVTPEVGIPIITSVIGFLLGKSTQKKSSD